MDELLALVDRLPTAGCKRPHTQLAQPASPPAAQKPKQQEQYPCQLQTPKPPTPQGLPARPGASPAAQCLHPQREDSPPHLPPTTAAAAALPGMVLVGAHTDPGTRYGTLNQDAVMWEELHEPSFLKKHRWKQCYLSVVLDGHGMLGELAAEAAGKAIIHHLKHSALRKRQLSEFAHHELEGLMHAAFEAGHQAALRSYSEAPRSYTFPKGTRFENTYQLQTLGSGESIYTHPMLGARILEFGTTATCSVVQDRTVVIANVGDSLAVLGQETLEGSYEGEIACRRHWGYDEGERARLEAEQGDRVSISPEDGYLTVEEGRLRGFQLAMTRALGHRFLTEFGVLPAPSVSVRSIAPEHVCLILASDGVWECMNPTEAVRTVCDVMAEGRSAEDAARELVHEAVRTALATLRNGAEADNTSACVIVFDEI